MGDGRLAELIAQLPHLLGGHLALSMAAIVSATLVSVPLGVVSSRSRRLGGAFLAAAGLVQTIPSMALLALMVPILGGTIGFLPAFVALCLYGVLPTLRNTIVGINEVDPVLVESARGVGMTERQCLLRVELPLALPVIVAGIRTASVWVIGTATLSTPVGAPSLGNYIFAGLQTRNWLSVLFGCFFAAALAILVDRLIRRVETALREKNRVHLFRTLVFLLLLVCLGFLPALTAWSRLGIISPAGAPPGKSLAGEEGKARLVGQKVIIGTKTFTEQYILASLLRRHLESKGATVEELTNMGSTILFDALRKDTVDLYVDYTGTIWSTVMKRSAPLERSALFIEVADYLYRTQGILTLGRLGFENAYCLAMRRDRARELGVESIADLAPINGLTVGGDPEFFARPDWTRVRDLYQLDSLSTRGMDSTFMYGAVRDREIDLIGAYTTDSRIDAFDLVVLDDPQQGFPPYDAILLLSPQTAKRVDLIQVLQPLINQIDDAAMRGANRLVDLEGMTPARAGASLYASILGNP